MNPNILTENNTIKVVPVCKMVPELWDVLNLIGEEIEEASGIFHSLSFRHADLFDAGQVEECENLFAESYRIFERLWVVAGGVL